MCRPEESVYLEHGVQQKQSIYEGLFLKTQESKFVFGRPAALTSLQMYALSCPFQTASAPQLDWRLIEIVL